jgi:hypothetical protein
LLTSLYYYYILLSPYYSQENNHGQDKKNILCCLFPWLNSGENVQSVQQDQQKQQQQQRQQQQQAIDDAPVQQAEGRTASVEETAQLLGQNLRARTASPSLAAGGAAAAAAAPTTADAAATRQSSSNNCSHDNKDSNSATIKPTTTTTSTTKQQSKASPSKKPQESITHPSTDDKAQQPQPQNEQQSGVIKSILKVKHCVNYHHNTTTPKPSKKVQSASSPDGKRHLFPAYEGKSDKKVNDNRKVVFIPMARVLTIPSRKDIPLSQKAQVSGCIG